MEIGIVTHFKVISHYITAQRIEEVFKKHGHTCTLHNFDDQNINEKNILYIGTVFAANLSYLSRFLPESKVVMYATCEGFPIMDLEGIERKVAKDITIIPVSNFVRLCLETIHIPTEDVIHHGINMNWKEYDTKYYNYLKHHMKSPVVLCISGNMERKGLDRFILASKLVSRKIPEAHFILHSGQGFVNIPKMIQDLDIPNLWYTNAFGMLSWQKINSLYKLCWLLAMPSYCEGFGLPMIEGFRFNKPTVAVDVEPYNEIVENEKTGLLVPIKKVVQRRYMDRFLFPLHTYSVDAYADSIIRLLESKKLRKRMASNINRVKSRFEAGTNYTKILTYFS